MGFRVSERLLKHGKFGHSGLYSYSSKEIPRLGLSWPPPPEIGEKAMYDVYRPAPVLASAVKDGLFTRMTLTRGHPEDWVDSQNFKEHVVGFTGDVAEIEYLKDEDEVSINGSMTLADEVALESYDRGVVDLSPGYTANFAWRRGQHKGKPYDAIMTKITETNHLAMVNRGRGGPLSVITDTAEKLHQKARKVASGLWWAVKRRTLVKDEVQSEIASFATGFRSGLNALVEGRAAAKDEDIASGIDELKKLLEDLPFGDERSLLMRYMDDLKLMKEEPEDVVRDAVDLACALLDKLDRSAMGEVKQVFGDGAAEEDKDMRTLAELLGGKKAPVVVDEQAMCPSCKGEPGKMKDCADCHGTGKAMAKDVTPPEAAGIPEVESPAKGSPEIPTTAKSDKTVGDEPDPAIPAAASAAQPASPSPAGVPATTPVAAPGAAGGQRNLGAMIGDLAKLLDEIMRSPEAQALKAPPAGTPAAAAAPIPGDAPAAPAAPAPAPVAAPAAAPAPSAPAAAPAAAPAEKKEAPPFEKKEEKKKEAPAADSAADPASSLTALISSGGKVSDDEPASLDGIINSIKGRKN